MTIVLITVFAYLAATGLLVLDLRRDGLQGLRPWWWLATTACLLHAGRHLLTWQASGATDMHFFAALSLVGLGMAALTTLFGIRGRMAALGVVVFPIAAATLVGSGMYAPHSSEVLDWRLQLHAWLALLAYATLAIAALLAIMLWLQERALRRRQVQGWLRALPPLVELETLLFRSITVGFVLLTATLLTGVLFVEDLLAQHLLHKTVLSLLSWLVFGGLLAGRLAWGWRGTKAVHWTLVAMALLILAFFGSKAVLELVLQRAG
ncbi:cytochrome C assembly family protein [Marilutibacter alkalisoli]|uniref:Inner membrane protein YpjD n=1 Tax=Marilutibacter alkalisoli TaxID=2591633 RepID=A0A514BT89_9GAMM|nr:cytochrome c biogenesis protein CcsA [Lysobacter alkalisoli]QDH70577.1 inner membrane protein YpjD [Lysobacter alkalisoli]